MNFSSGRCIAALLTFFSLSACGGGGGGGSPSPVQSPGRDVTLPQNGTVSFDGQAITGEYLRVAGSNRRRLGLDLAPGPSTVSFTTSNSEIVGVSFDYPRNSGAVGLSSEVELSERTGINRLRNSAGDVAVVNFLEPAPSANGAYESALIIAPGRFKYQTFGVWSRDYREPVPLSGVIFYPIQTQYSAGSYGVQTSATNVARQRQQISGTATYSGASIGRGYTTFGPNEDDSFTSTSQINVTTDFNTASITSSNTQLSSGSGASHLNFTATGEIRGAEVIQAPIREHSGWANMRFFGPNAEEVGGTFRAAYGIPGGRGTYIGSFGAAK